MRCIFCKQESSKSKSVEHIVPESLGNKEHVMPKGAVCDDCNNYFALKIEKPSLETNFFSQLRFRNFIESKKGRIPRGKGLIPRTGAEPEIYLPKDSNNIEVNIDPESFQLIKDGIIKQMWVPMSSKLPEKEQCISRLIAKISFEMLFLRLSGNDLDTREFLIDEENLNPLRNYVRYNSNNENWIYSVRKIYEENEKFFLNNEKPVDMIFECDFIYTKEMELYFVIAFKGVEFVINMAGDSIDGYQKWLKDNNHQSPLYANGKSFASKLTPEFLTRNR